ncbi:methionine--tRNA ligase subunit beta [Patescibacteria group bacterium]
MSKAITFEDFQKLDIRIAKIKAAEVVDGADKLLKLTLDAGDLGEREIVSGIRDWYEPKSLIGRKIVYLSNLEAKEIKGIESQGMLLAPEDGKGNCVLLVPEKDIETGVKVH